MFQRIVVITKKTRMQELLDRHCSREQGAFFLSSRGGSIEEYEIEHAAYSQSLQALKKALPASVSRYEVERTELPHVLFRDTDLLLVIGPDGLCANTAKYAGNLPMLTVNPDPERVDGKLMLFSPREAAAKLPQLLKGKFDCHNLTLAEAKTNDGQRLLGFNDFLIGRRDQISARYTLHYDGKTERQSSSGILVSTGVGSSGWLSSAVNGMRGAGGNSFFGLQTHAGSIAVPFEWDAEYLAFLVREPFRSRFTGASLVAGKITKRYPLAVTSEMPEGGVVFSDGVPEDALEFNSGSIVTINLAPNKARLIAR